MKTLSMTSEEMTYVYETLRWRSSEFSDTDQARDVRICKKIMSSIEDEMLVAVETEEKELPEDGK